MIKWVDTYDRGTLQEYINDNDLESIVTFINNACTACYHNGKSDGYDKGYNDGYIDCSNTWL